MARSRSFSSIPMISRFHKICSFVTHCRLAFVGCQDFWQLLRQILNRERPSPSFLHHTEASLSLCWAGDETCITIGRFLRHMVLFFSCRDASEVQEGYKWLSCLKNRATIKISFFVMRDE